MIAAPGDVMTSPFHSPGNFLLDELNGLSSTGWVRARQALKATKGS